MTHAARIEVEDYLRSFPHPCARFECADMMACRDWWAGYRMALKGTGMYLLS